MKNKAVFRLLYEIMNPPLSFEFGNSVDAARVPAIELSSKTMQGHPAKR